MEILRDKAIMLRVRNPKQITTVIPNSKELPMNKVVVKWGLDEVLSLRSLNIFAPSPITKRYSWPGQYTPFDHQKDTASFMTLNPFALTSRVQVKLHQPYGRRTIL